MSTSSFSLDSVGGGFVRPQPLQPAKTFPSQPPAAAAGDRPNAQAMGIIACFVVVLFVIVLSSCWSSKTANEVQPRYQPAKPEEQPSQQDTCGRLPAVVTAEVPAPLGTVPPSIGYSME